MDAPSVCKRSYVVWNGGVWRKCTWLETSCSISGNHLCCVCIFNCQEVVFKQKYRCVFCIFLFFGRPASCYEQNRNERYLYVNFYFDIFLFLSGEETFFCCIVFWYGNSFQMECCM